jgi:cytochrome c biogenesis protein
LHCVAHNATRKQSIFFRRHLLTKNKSRILSFFSSVQLAIALLLLIALFILIGTLIPQREAAGELSERLSPTLFSFLQKIQILDLYHSILFYLLSGLLSVNLIVCSLNRFPMAWRRFRLKPAPQNHNVFKDIPDENNFQIAADVQAAADVSAKLLQGKYRNVTRTDIQGSVFLCAYKGHFSIFGVYIIHLSILVLIAGALTGSVYGIEGHADIMEGETSNVLHLRYGGQHIHLPFSVRCDKFTVEHYENGMPKTFQSDLSFYKDNQIVHSEKLRVNHPIEFEGFRFYQSTYGALAGGKATMALLKDDGRRDVINVAKGYSFALPGKEGFFQILRVEENLMEMGPAIKITVRSEKEEATFWVFQEIEKLKTMNPDIINQVPMFNPDLFHPYTFTLMGLEKKYYTGLQVNSDPGAPIAAAAAVLLICGLMLVLFSYARSIWIRLEQTGNKTLIAIAGQSHKNKSGLQKEMQSLLAKLKDNLENPK